MSINVLKSILVIKTALVGVGEAMERGLRDCCRSMRIGKMLIMSDEGMHEAKVFYAKFPPDINKRNVLLMYPIMCTYCCCSVAITTSTQLT